MDKIIVASHDELVSLISKSLEKVLLDQKHQVASVDNLPELLTIAQASTYLNLAKQTIYGFTSKGQIPHIKKGKKLYFKRSELRQWLSGGSGASSKNL